MVRQWALDSRGLRSRSTHITALGDTRGPFPVCPRCGQICGLLEWKPPFQIEIDQLGQAFDDLPLGINTGEYEVVSDRARTCFEAIGITGITYLSEAVPRRVTGGGGRRGGRPPKYWVAEIAQSDAEVDFQSSGCDFDCDGGQRLCNLCGGCLITKMDRLVFHKPPPADLDICRIFVLRLAITSERFASVVREHRLSGLNLIPLEEYSFNGRP